METNKSAYWLGKLANLNAARTEARGIAPHKPLMLLSVIDLIEAGEFKDALVPFHARLVSQFRSYWDLVLDRQRNRPDIAMPFNALGGIHDSIWERFDEHGAPSSSKLTTRLCKLDPGLFSCLQDPAFRQQARRGLIASYFTPGEQVGICERLGLPIPDSAEMADFKQNADAFKASRKKGRDSRFKVDVTSGYQFTCALTGYRLETTDGYIVQAAHIHQHAKSGNDDPRNGLALTPDAHWMFDAGLWTVVPNGDDLLVQIALGRYTESSPHGKLLAQFHNQPLNFQLQARLRPDPKHFEWHRKAHRFQSPDYHDH
ncbi:HNH endonuclease [Haloferula sp.]|uniref:HNH endonuclease n=1 Tax=Haloferula sp. TaxID=2497595 RepID=UPI003C706AF5